MSVLYIAMNGLSSFLAGGNGVNGEFRPCIDVSAHEDVFLCGLVCKLVCNGINSTEELNLGVLEKVLEDHCLADGKDDHIGVKRNQFSVVIGRGEASVLVIYGGAFLEDDALYLVRAEHFLGPPARVDYNAILAGFGPLFEGCGHNVLRLKR